MSPRLVWDIFENVIASTPRCSKSEDKIREKIKKFIKEEEKKNNISHSIKEDKIGNLSIQRRATDGYQNYPTIIFQAHMDMVCETNLQDGFNFKQNGIPLHIQENEKWVDAIGTTLGADDGIGVAFALALLVDSDLKCGNIISLFTVNEEDGFDGANYIEPEKLDLKGKFYVNLDSGPINQVTIGSVGGRRVYLRKSFEFLAPTPEKLRFYKIKVEGLLGGHSGGDIHLPRANANKMIARLMTVL
ncbi:MAG: M20/M25/M40 family metallo-hydrolase, partial [Candidatus Lokiarchaeota archaeon]|nr:M20/M25/M40 family metallo-hydrolase [Candidatus Lokiarchaeota archaeon]MBD3198573.1 M20/M25/M40 family metallo-hydrolase [Candidatus Lokiarchaeota archaeon]